MLGLYELTDSSCNRGYLLETQDEVVGGFAKWPDNSPGNAFIHVHFNSKVGTDVKFGRIGKLFPSPKSFK